MSNSNSSDEFTDASEWGLQDPSKIARETIWETVADLKKDEFIQKYNDIMGNKKVDAMMFLRSFVRFYYWDLKNAKAGVVTPAFGDLHFDNFGFISMTPNNRYVFNDFDDGGFAPVGLDILRYFVILKLAYPQIDQDALIDEYFSVVTGKLNPPDFDHSTHKSLFGDLVRAETNEKKALKKFQKGEAVLDDPKSNDHCLESDPDMEAKIKTFFATDARVKDNYNVLRAYKAVGKTTGGSAGYARYWASVEVKGWEFKHDIVELKEMTRTPGTDVGKWPTVNFDNRIDWLIHTLWPSSDTPHLDIQASIDSKPFWIRSRTDGKAFVDDIVVFPVLRVQVGITALKHKAAWGGHDRRDWLKKNRDYLVNRYGAVFQNLMNEFQQHS